MIIVAFDLISIAALMVYLYLIPQYIKVDAERHRNLLFETKEFALEFQNLPEVSHIYPVFTLKLDLREHIENIIKNQD
jgi:hypothetical protein